MLSFPGHLHASALATCLVEGTSNLWDLLSTRLREQITQTVAATTMKEIQLYTRNVGFASTHGCGAPEKSDTEITFVFENGRMGGRLVMRHVEALISGYNVPTYPEDESCAINQQAATTLPFLSTFTRSSLPPSAIARCTFSV